MFYFFHLYFLVCIHEHFLLSLCVILCFSFTSIRILLSLIICYGEPIQLQPPKKKNLQTHAHALHKLSKRSGRYNTGYPGTNYNQYQGINQNRNSVNFDDIYIPYVNRYLNA